MKTEIGSDTQLAAKLLQEGQLVAIPTETVYGLAGNALNESAILQIFKAKDRPFFNPLIIHLPNWEKVGDWVLDLPEQAVKLAAEFAPGPLTFLLNKKPTLSDLVTAGSPKVAIRIPAHPLTHELLGQLDFPLAAPSANPFGYVSPTKALHVLAGLDGKIPYILDGGGCQIGLESTIVDFENQQVIVRRKGGVAIEEIEEVLGEKVLVQTGVEEHPVAPGQLKSHYATTTPLILGKPSEFVNSMDSQKIAVLAFGDNMSGVRADFYFQLSENANLDEAAQRLFSMMRQADASGADLILTELLPEIGLGRAINDRLRRAAHQG